MKHKEFFPQIASGITPKCERCDEEALMKTAWMDWEARVFTCLYVCRCGNIDWFAFQFDEEEEKPGGYL